MNPCCTFCGYYCAFIAFIGIFFFAFLLALEATSSQFMIYAFFHSSDTSGQVGAMGLSIGLSAICALGCFFCTYRANKKKASLENEEPMNQSVENAGNRV